MGDFDESTRSGIKMLPNSSKCITTVFSKPFPLLIETTIQSGQLWTWPGESVGGHTHSNVNSGTNRIGYVYPIILRTQCHRRHCTWNESLCLPWKETYLNPVVNAHTLSNIWNSGMQLKLTPFHCQPANKAFKALTALASVNPYIPYQRLSLLLHPQPGWHCYASASTPQNGHKPQPTALHNASELSINYCIMRLWEGSFVCGSRVCVCVGVWVSSDWWNPSVTQPCGRACEVNTIS